MTDVQRWIHDADAGVCSRLENGNYEFLPHGSEVVRAADYERDVAAAEVKGWNAALDAASKAVDEWLIRRWPPNVFDHLDALRKPVDGAT